MLEVRALNAYYGSAHVVEDVSLDMGAEPVALIGRNGMGKTTLCKAIVGLLGATGRSDGSVRLNGDELQNRPSYRIAKAGVGYVPQGRRLFTSLTVDEHLEIVGASKGADWTPDRVYELFPRLAERKHVSGTSLSGGEQQMLAIGRALMSRPRLLMLDEPSLGLAPLIARQIFEAIRTLNRQDGLTVLIVEQNANHALKLAHRGYVMVNGVITMSGSGKELLANPQVQSAYLEGGRH